MIETRLFLHSQPNRSLTQVMLAASFILIMIVHRQACGTSIRMNKRNAVPFPLTLVHMTKGYIALTMPSDAMKIMVDLSQSIIYFNYP